MQKTITAALIIIGNEILSGRTQDKNLAYLAEKLNAKGIRLMEVRVIPDVEPTIIETVNALRVTYDYIFTTGGIGPTHDDITTAAIAKAFGVGLYRHPDAEAALRDAYKATDAINEARLKMADVPVGASLVPCAATAAPGIRMQNVFIMAGVPRIMQSMLETILPQLESGAVVQSLSVTTNLPEGTIAAGLTEIQNRFPDVEIGSYPHYIEGGYQTTLVCRATDASRNAAATAEIRTLIAGAGGVEIAAS